MLYTSTRSVFGSNEIVNLVENPRRKRERTRSLYESINHVRSGPIYFFPGKTVPLLVRFFARPRETL